ncbi:MAG: SET domain-containing protein-lysine N-methyltransferase [Candidatus Jorgensenbacteria bacterium]
MDNPKVQVKKTKKYGLGTFAREPIRKGGVIASFDGKIYRTDPKYWNGELENHAIQFQKNRWRDSQGIARLINHSCEPNCGLKNTFDIVAMRNIKRGEEITWDYDMTENTRNWRMKCRCGKPNCRKLIGAYRTLPDSVREKYKGYISEWLLKKNPSRR